jgi:multicomponent K+:H+ antiporter subunit D
MIAHLAILPILTPFIAGVGLLGLRGNLSPSLTRHLSTGAVLVQIVIAALLLNATSSDDILIYRLGDWSAPWGIVLVADRLAAWMVLVTTLLALFAIVHAGDGADLQGRHFHVLFQMQLFGLTGAFLTGDLFNLFVFFEILLIASYGLLLHGGGARRTRAGLHYVVLNLLGSTVFLFAAGAIYASLGTLNMADIAARAAVMAPENLGLARSGGLLLLAVFALKAALLPLHLWLPAAYANTCAPVAALFAIMTKVGAYAILRTDTLLFGAAAGPLAGLFDPWMLPLALATLLIGTLGALAAGSLGTLCAYLVVSSVGTLLIAFALGDEGVAAGLYYLPHSTFVGALLFLLADALKRRRPAHASSLTPDADMPHHALWGSLFFAAAIAAAGLPPLSGFLGKFLILRAAPGHYWVWAAILVSALLIVIALARAGSRLFFKTRLPDNDPTTPEVMPEPASMARELFAIGGLLALIMALTCGAGTVHEFTRAAAAQLADPAAYIAAVLGDRQ